MYIVVSNIILIRSHNQFKNANFIEMAFNFIGTIWRPAGLSIIYLGLMLYSPMVPIPTHRTMAGHTGIYLKICICLAFIVAIAQIIFHIVLLSLPPYGYFLQNCKLYIYFDTKIL